MMDAIVMKMALRPAKIMTKIATHREWIESGRMKMRTKERHAPVRKRPNMQFEATRRMVR